MAGAFGFERGEHYDVSIKCGERVLLPRVREASLDTLIIADGFSCREQIAQQTSRRALHLAEVIDLALKDGAATNGHQAIEDHGREVLKAHEFAPAPVLKTALTLGVGAALATGALWYFFKRIKTEQ